jgi:N-acetylglucosamine kinase-like BadF-type ATPase
MIPAQSVHFGIDGGATHSFGVAIGRDGHVLATAKSGSLNFFGASLGTARRNLEFLLGALRQSSGAHLEFSRAVIGCAALFTEATSQEKENLCGGLLPFGRTRVVSDSMTASAGATLGQPGVVIIAGTGSIVVAQDAKGRFAQAGGWGHLLGDEGSAYWIAREAVRAAIAAQEEHGPATRLTSLVPRSFGAGSMCDIVPVIYDAAFTKERFADLTRWLIEEGAGDDSVFRDICCRAGQELAAQTLAVVKRASLKLSPLPVYLVGGVLNNMPFVRESLIDALKLETPVNVETPTLPPVLGAAAMALCDAGVELSPSVVTNLTDSYLKE